MKNIITIAIILILPVLIYSFMHTRTSSDISALAKDNNKPGLMIFTSAMCMDCQKMKTVIKEIEPSYSDKINFISINAIDKSKSVKDMVKKYKVVLVPTLIFLDVNQNETNRVEGFIPKEELISDIEEAING